MYLKNSHIFRNGVSRYIINYLFILLTSSIVAWLMAKSLWNKHTSLMHTAIELLCIFSVLTCFLIVWFTYKVCNISNRIIGIGFFAVAAFDILHAYYFQVTALNSYKNYDLSARYWIFARFSEAMILLLSSTRLTKVKMSKYGALMVSFTLTAGTAFVLYYFPGALPVLLTESGVTLPKIIMEIVIIAIFCLALINMLRKVQRKSIISYNYICLAIIIIIPTEISFTLFTSIDSYFNINGHILRLVSNYLLMKGIFEAAVIYPYNAVTSAKDKLRETKHELNDILNGLPLAILSYDTDSTLKFTNKKALELLECSCDNVIGKKREQIRKMFLSEKNTTETLFKNNLNEINVIDTYKTLKGNETVLNISGFRYKNGYLISFTDTKKDQELSNLKVQTRTILNSISNQVVITDTNCKIIMFNKSFKQCIEMRDKDILGSDIKILYNELKATSNDSPHMIAKHVEKNEDYIEISLVTPRGNQKIIYLNYNPVKNVKNEVIGYIFVSSDITEMKKEQERAFNQEKLAIVGQLGAGIVHDTKNHIALIKGYCQLLEQKTNDELLISYARRIQSISEDVSMVIADFLSLAKPQETTMDIMSIKETIESMRYLLEGPSFLKDVKININFDTNDRDIKGDGRQIKQVILNMVKNAVEAMADIENPILNINTRACDEKNEMQLTFSDNGKGISKDDLDKIGGLFFTTKENGTGLGLNMCYKIIKEHGGTVEVRSEEGKGTDFIISIPYIDE